MNKNTIVYFLFSKTQYEKRVEIEKQYARKYTPGKVKTKKKGFQEYTEMCTSDSNGYSDAKVVAYGKLSDMVYTYAK